MMESTIKLPASCLAMSQEEMTYTQGGATMKEALGAWLLPFYGWFKGCIALREARLDDPRGWIDNGYENLQKHMAQSTENLLFDVGCIASMTAVCLTLYGMIPTALIILS